MCIMWDWLPLLSCHVSTTVMESSAFSNEKCSWPLMCDRITLGVALVPITWKIMCMLVHKVFVGHTADYLASLLTESLTSFHSRQKQSCSNCDLVIPGTKWKIGNRAFSIAYTPCLDSVVKRTCLTASFRRKLKSFLSSYIGEDWTETEEWAIILIVECTTSVLCNCNCILLLTTWHCSTSQMCVYGDWPCKLSNSFKNTFSHSFNVYCCFVL